MPQKTKEAVLDNSSVRQVVPPNSVRKFGHAQTMDRYQRWLDRRSHLQGERERERGRERVKRERERERERREQREDRLRERERERAREREREREPERERERESCIRNNVHNGGQPKPERKRVCICHSSHHTLSMRERGGGETGGREGGREGGGGGGGGGGSFIQS